MENFKHRNKEIEFWSETGEVLGQNKYSETHVSSSGGGHGCAPRIHSTTVTNHDFWIKKEDGSEKSVQLEDHDIPLREGQKITLISAGVKGKDSGYISVLVNHNANKHWFINKAGSLNNLLKIDHVSGKSILIAGGLHLLGAVVTDSPETGFVIALGFVVYRLATKIPRMFKMTKALNKHLESLAQQAYQNT